MCVCVCVCVCVCACALVELAHFIIALMLILLNVNSERFLLIGDSAVDVEIVIVGTIRKEVVAWEISSRTQLE